MILYTKNAFWFLLLICTLTINSFSQNVSVDPLTGSPIVTIPIYSMNFGKISIPINIQYGEGAIGVMEGEGSVGMGWNLTCGGGIYREVRGLPDDYTSGSVNGWLFNGNAAAIQSFNPTSDDSFGTTETDENADYNFINGRGYVNDTEPDLYTVSAPGLYFQFILDGTGLPKLLSYQDVKIIRNATSFTVQTNTGVSYSFTLQETNGRRTYQHKLGVPDMFTTDYNYYNAQTINFTQSWKLTNITDSEGNAVTYTYRTLPQAVGGSDYKVRIKTSNALDTLFSSSDRFAPTYISTITAGNYRALFTWNSKSLLQTLSIKDTGLQDSILYSFAYQLARSTTDNKLPYMYRSFLTELKPIVQCVAQEPYKFSYQGLVVSQYTDPVTFEMPWKSRLSQDFFGYYNGVTTNNNVPQLYFYTALTDSRRFSLRTISGATLTQTLTGANRNVSSLKIGLGALTQITYPAGGNTKILYERNKYYDSNVGQVLFGPGQRVSATISNGGEAAYGRNASASNSYHLIRKDYTYTKSETDTTTSGSLTYPPVFGFATGIQLIRTPYNLGPAGAVLYGRVKERVTGQGATVYEYLVSAAYPSISYSTDWIATKSKIARNPSNRLALTNVKNGYYTFPFAPNPNYDFERGLLVRQSEYAETGALVRERKLKYSRIEPAKQIISGLRFEKINECDCFHFSKYQVITGTTSVLTSETVKEVNESISTDTLKTVTYYHYNSNLTTGNFLMDSVRTVLGDGTVKRQKIRYVKDFEAITNPVTTDQMANAIKLMIAANRHGEVVEQFSSFRRGTGAEITTGASLILYKDFGLGKILPSKILNLLQVASFTPAYVVAGATQGFAYDNSKYLLAQSIDEYDATGRPISVSDDKKNKIAYHNALSYTTSPIAVFSNASAKETIYDGFEFVTDRSLSNTATPAYEVGRTGERAVILPTPYKLFNNSVKNIGTPYRASCWVKAATNADITIRLVDVVNNTLNIAPALVLQYLTPNQWVYLEGIVNIAITTPATMRMEVSANAVVSLDDIILRPLTAVVSSQTILPIKGVTSQTDDRGNSTKIVYDGLGRKVNVFDRQRNLVELNEYKLKGKAQEDIRANFYLTDQLFTNQSYTATAYLNSCLPSVSYQWKVDGVVVGSAASLTTSFSNAGRHVIELKVTNNATLNYQIIASDRCVYGIQPTVGFNFNVTPNTIAKLCDSTPKTFTVSNLNITGCNDSVLYSWLVSFDNGSSWVCPASGNPTCNLNTSVLSFSEARAYIMKVTVTVSCSQPDVLCQGQKLFAELSSTINITYLDDSPCQ
jgi:YD repeat-containing protein